MRWGKFRGIRGFYVARLRLFAVLRPASKAIVSNFLPSFAMVNHGQSAREHRFVDILPMREFHGSQLSVVDRIKHRLG